MLRFLPGVSGAVCAFIALKVLAFMQIIALWIEIGIYVVVFVVVSFAVDRAMSRYGR